MGSAERDHEVIVAASQLEHVILTTRLDGVDAEDALILHFVQCVMDQGGIDPLDYSKERLLDAWRRFRDALDRRLTGPRDDVVEFDVLQVMGNEVLLAIGETKFLFVGDPSIFKFAPHKPVVG